MSSLTMSGRELVENSSRVPRHPVFLTGMMGAGKSTLALLVAQRWEAPWVDLDARIERIFGASIPTLFARGEAFFRRCEREALRLLVTEPGFSQRTVVVATGGGVVVEAVNRERMRGVGAVIYIEVAVAELTRRLLASSLAQRPLLGGDEEAVVARLTEILERRRSAYEEADGVVDGNGPPQDVTHRLLANSEVVHARQRLI